MPGHGQDRRAAGVGQKVGSSARRRARGASHLRAHPAARPRPVPARARTTRGVEQSTEPSTARSWLVGAHPPPPERRAALAGVADSWGAAHQPVAQRVAGWKDGPTGAAQAPAPALSGPSSTWHQPALHERVAASEVTRLAAGRCAIAPLAPLMALCMTGASADAAIGLPWLGYDSDEGPMPKPALLEGTSRLPRPKSVRRLSRNRRCGFKGQF